MTDSKTNTKKAKEPVYKRLKENQPGFTMNSGKFAGRRYKKDFLYPATDIPDEHKAKFITAKRVVIQPALAGETAVQTKNEEEKGK